jgi:hypothetical protein
MLRVFGVRLYHRQNAKKNMYHNNQNIEKQSTHCTDQTNLQFPPQTEVFYGFPPHGKITTI